MYIFQSFDSLHTHTQQLVKYFFATVQISPVLIYCQPYNRMFFFVIL